MTDQPRLAKVRLDRLLVERGLQETRQRAQALIMAGRVKVDGVKIEKAGVLVAHDAKLELSGPPSRYVGRGGLKMEAAIREFHIDAAGKTFLDIGASTGGFVDCLLQHGASKVIAVDVGTGQFDWRLRNDPRVKLLEKTNARFLKWDQIGEKADGITVDVSFISATMVLPALIQFCNPGTRLVVLVKPQFEVGKGQVGRGGIVKSEELRLASVDKIHRAVSALGFVNIEVIPSPILGAEGNQEYLLTGIFHESSRSAGESLGNESESATGTSEAS